MYTLKYILRNVTRNKIRSILTILSVGFCLALMTVLYGYIAMQDSWGKSSQQYHRIVVMNTQGFSGELPIAYVDRVRSMEGVVAAVPFSWFGGNYQEKQMPFAQFGTDPSEVFKVWPEYKITEAEWKAWQDDRQGCVVDRRLAERQGWKLGDRIPLQGTFFPFNLDLHLVGMFDAPAYTDSLWFDWKYLDEQMKSMASDRAGNSGIIYAKTTSPDRMAPLATEIDSKFASSENPTRTQTEAAFAQMFVDMIGNIRVFIRNIALAVVFSLSLVTANTMAMSMRERTTEIAVLKAIGFTRGRVLRLVLGESTVIAILGGILGIGFGCFSLQALHGVSAQFFPVGIADLVGPWLLMLFGLAAFIGFISGIFPAIQASRLSVVAGLRRVV